MKSQILNKFVQLTFIAVVLLLSGCATNKVTGSPKTPASGQLSTHSLVHDGDRRFFHIRPPSDFDSSKRYSLVLVLHGGGGRGFNFDQLMTDTTLSAAADRRSVMLVFPEGKRKQWNDGRPEIRKRGRQYDDVGFISALIDLMVARHGVDPDRVYATGISNGGHMALRLAAELSTKIVAIAPVAAQLPQVTARNKPQFPISVMMVLGTKDPLVPYKGGHIRLSKAGRSRGQVLSAVDTIRYFRQHNGCDGVPDIKSAVDADPSDGTRVQFHFHRRCKNRTKVTLVKVIGGGHTWPGGYQYLRARRVGPVSRDINASELILDFFVGHERGRQ